VYKPKPLHEVIRLRPKFEAQREFEFPTSNLKLTREYYAKYEAISTTLDANPEIVDLAHRDLRRALIASNGSRPARVRFTTEHVLRLLIVQSLEGLSLRQTVVRVDDSPALRQFVRLGVKPMMDFTTLDKLKNALRPVTWKKIHRALARHAASEKKITGHRLRLDTTAVETNIHWPTDSTLLWDTYRVLARLIERARVVDTDVAGSGRLHPRRAKREALVITRAAAQKGRRARSLRRPYQRLVRRVEGILSWAACVAHGLVDGIESGRYVPWAHAQAEALVEELAHFHPLGERVVDQARRRVLHGESVPNDEKLFSLFEPHTELLRRGKAGKDIEFGHMIQIQQVGEKFITEYEVYDQKPVEHTLLGPALAQHRELFGADPAELSADKGYYKSMDALHELERTIDVVSIAKKGKRTPTESEREQDPLFRHAQAFRAGVEGSISFLKRMLRLARCFNKSWDHFVATVGQTVFAHNLLVLARGG
jgi:IS5 family transposase